LEKALVAPAAEHFVLYKLHLLGLLATHAPRNAPTVDILVMNPDESVLALLQVKGRTRGKDKGWHMHRKHEDIVKPRLFYAFVDLEPDVPVTYIVPSKVVADNLRASHGAWLAAPGVRRPHRDNEMRRIQPTYSFKVPGYEDQWIDVYREQWHLLKATDRPLA
jgi:hypothetical protein